MADHIVYLGLGSNLGDRMANLRSAINNLTPQLQVREQSSIYETLPVGYTDQPKFLNQVVKAESYEKPEPLLAHLKRLEIVLGRKPGIPNGPRLIDIDILFYDDLVLNTPSLVIPHPRLAERGFVLMPLNEIASELVHPALNETVSQLLARCDTTGISLYGMDAND